MQQLKIVVSDRLKGNTAFMDFAKSLPESFNNIGTEIHTARNRLRIMDISHLGVDGINRVMVKRYHGLFWFQKIDYTFIRQPKCRKAYNNTEELRRRGFNAAEELAFVEVWNHGLYQYAFFISAVAEGIRLDNLVLTLQKQGEKTAIAKLIKQYAALVKGLHEHGVLYWDMNCGNVICHQEVSDGNWKFTLIDTNRVRFFDADTPLDLDTVIGDLILMNPKLGTVEQFIAEYLKQRGIYSEAEVNRIREVQRHRYERKRPVKRIVKTSLKKIQERLL